MANKNKASVLTEISHVISGAAESMNKSVQDWADKSKQKRLERTFSDINEAIRFLIDGKSVAEVENSFQNHAYLGNMVQYNYLKAGRWLDGYPVYVDKKQWVKFGYDYNGRHWGIEITNGLMIFVRDANNCKENYHSYADQVRQLDEMVNSLYK